MSREVMHNYPEGYEEGPYCPYTKLVQITASLANIKFTPQTFCTEEVSNAQFSDGAIHRLKSADFYPRPSCLQINRVLTQQLEIVGNPVKAPSDEDATKKIAKAKDMPAKLKVFESYKKTKDAYERRKTIVDRWRKVIFETSVSTTSDEKNEHFRQFESENELPEEEIISRVTQFTSLLNKITGYVPNLILGGGGAINCPQSPEHHHYGSYED